MRFFTVYGPAGRPDMAYYTFAERLIEGKTIDLYNGGSNIRDFTYIDDAANFVARIINCIPGEDDLGVMHEVVNIGNNHPICVRKFVKILCDNLKKVNMIDKDVNIMERIRLVDAQPGDVDITYADIEEVERKTGYNISTSIEDGLLRFCEWYKEYLLLDKQ